MRSRVLRDGSLPSPCRPGQRSQCGCDGLRRIHPLLDWTELNIWEYIEAEGIPAIDLYFDTHGTGVRYRSLGCGPCTQPVESSAATAREIVVELSTGRFATVAERSGRAQDAEDGGGLETLRRDGYM